MSEHKTKLLFTTSGLPPEKRISSFRDAVVERMGVPIEQSPMSDKSFIGKFESLSVGGFHALRVTEGPLRTSLSPSVFRRHDRGENVALSVKLRGESSVAQGDHHSTQREGDLMVLGGQPFEAVSKEGSSFLQLSIPRKRLEDALGPIRYYSGLVMPSHEPSTRLVRAFLQELFDVQDTLDNETSERMTSIAIDLLIAGIASRMARQVPGRMQDLVLLQRAKAYIEANLSDFTLDPAQVASAVGISLRRLQELFRRESQQISDSIWRQRLNVAARRLADPACWHLAVSTVAYNSGFANPAHFSRRFRELFDLTPSEYRAAALNDSQTVRRAR